MVVIDSLDNEDVTLDALTALRFAVKEARGAASASKPVKALILTHSHPDHISGAGAVLKEGPDVKVVAHESFVATASKNAESPLYKTLAKRAMFQFGSVLGGVEGGYENMGIGGRAQ